MILKELSFIIVSGIVTVLSMLLLIYYFLKLSSDKTKEDRANTLTFLILTGIVSALCGIIQAMTGFSFSPHPNFHYIYSNNIITLFTIGLIIFLLTFKFINKNKIYKYSLCVILIPLIYSIIYSVF